MSSILLTGSAGAIGRRIGPHLIEAGHTVRGFDLVPTDWADDAVVGDLTDRRAVAEAIAGIDTVIHLAANPFSHTPFNDLIGPNYTAPRQLVELAAETGTMRRLILASTIQVYYGHRRLSPDAQAQLGGLEDVAPGNDYALSKVWLEHLGEWAARDHGFAVLAVRVGWFVRHAEEREALSSSPDAYGWFLSHDDARRFFRAAVEAEYTGFHVVNATSQPAPGKARCSLQPALDTLGWSPEDTFDPASDTPA